MSETVGDYLLERLGTWGVGRIYGYPGDGINGILGCLQPRRSRQRPEFIQVRHEEMAAFMACAHAKFTGEVGVCMATSGPGAVHLLNGLYDAKLDHQPVVAIVGQQARAGLGGNYQQEIDLVTLFKDVAHEYVQMAMDAGPDPPPRRPGMPDRAGRAHGHRAHHPQRPAGGRGGDPAAAQARHGALRTGLSAAARPPSRGRPRSRRRGAELPVSGWRCSSGRARCTPPTRWRQVADTARRRGGQGAARQGGAAGRPAVGDRLDRPARHQAELDADAGVRHAADGRLELPLLGVPARGGPGARGADRHRRPDARHPLPDGGQPGRRQRRDAARADPAAGAQGGSLLARADRGRGRGVVEADGRTGRSSRPIRSTLSSSSRSCPSAFPTARSSPRTRARRPTGTPATSSCARA